MNDVPAQAERHVVSANVAAAPPAPPEAPAGAERVERPLTRRSWMRRESWLLAATDLSTLVVAGLVLQAAAHAGAFAGLALAGFAVAGTYRSRLTLRALDDAPRIVGVLLLCLLALSPSLFQQGRSEVLGRLAVLSVVVLIGRSVTCGLLRQLRRRRTYSERTVIIGAGRLGVELAQLLQDRPEHGLVPIGFVDAPIDLREETLPVPILGTIDHLDEVLRDHDAARVIVAFGRVREAQWVSIMRSAISNQVEVHVVPRFFDIGVGPRDIHVDEVWGIPLYRVRRSALRSRGWQLKRAVDIVASSVALLLLAPLMAVLALLVRQTGPGVLFRQGRIGQHGRCFEVLKFRSVRHGHDGDTTWSVAHGADRTRIGGILRRTSLDELPQLWNVLRGDMSLVGPRPERPHFAHRFGTDIPGYHDRHRLPVGLTGWAQVNGLRGDTSISQRARFDNFYVERWSLWFDIVILLRTLPAVLRDVLRGSR